VVLEPDKEKVRYYLIFATHHSTGIEVFKSAEIKAARIQDDIRHEARVEKSGQEEMQLDSVSPRSSVARKLRKLYLVRAKEKVIQRILETSDAGIAFSELFCEAMAFPLVTPGDLQDWLDEFKPAIHVILSGSTKRKKPSATEDDRIILVDSHMLESNG